MRAFITLLWLLVDLTVGLSFLLWKIVILLLLVFYTLLIELVSFGMKLREVDENTRLEIELRLTAISGKLLDLDPTERRRPKFMIGEVTAKLQHGKTRTLQIGEVHGDTLVNVRVSRARFQAIRVGQQFRVAYRTGNRKMLMGKIIADVSVREHSYSEAKLA